jgi:hypothetical protein
VTVRVGAIRKFARSLPDVTEEPHFHYSSFRVKGKIFATVPPEGLHLNVFVGEPELEIFPAAQPNAYEKLFWGKKLAGLRVTLAAAKPRDVEQLLEAAWLRKAPKKLASARTKR